VEHPIVWDGVSVALPGETLSRHRERTEPLATAAEQKAASELQPVSSGHAAIDTAFPPAQAEEPAPLVLEEEEMEEEEIDEEVAPDTLTPEVHSEAEFDPENASASHRVDPSSPSEFRLSSLFGRE
jgi:ribonuclease G